MKKYIFTILVTIFLGISQSFALVKIAAAIPDLGSIASYIGGDKVEVFSIAKGNANMHTVEVLPSYMIKVSRAKLYLKVGLALDQWSDEIANGSRNNNLTMVDCSNNVQVLEKPSESPVNLGKLGDVHPFGNPHYWLDPANGLVIATNILEALKKKDPDNADYYQKNFDAFKQEADKRMSGWKTKMAKLAGTKVIGYHSSWIYFAHEFDLTIAGYVEPLPGIPPTGKHLAGLVDLIKKNSITILMQEPYFPDDAPEFLARETRIKIFKVAPSCDNIAPGSYFKHFDDVIEQIIK
jgi:ABC-type Zn uptake system ZnuABC Zn-binding protein ZnuA